MHIAIFDVIIIIPPKPIKRFIYNCGKKFIDEPIKELYNKSKELYGLMEIYGEDMYIKTFNEFMDIKLLDTKTAKIQKRQDRGGQSQNRIARLRLETIHNYLKLSSEKANKLYTRNNIPIIKSLLIVGPGMKKDQIINYLDLKIPIYVKNYDGKDKQQLNKFMQEIITGQQIQNNKTELEEIEDILIRNPDLLVFGTEIDNHKDNIKKIYESKSIIDRYGCKIGLKYFNNNYNIYENDYNIKEKDKLKK